MAVRLLLLVWPLAEGPIAAYAAGPPVVAAAASTRGALSGNSRY